MENRHETDNRCRKGTVAFPARASFAGKGHGGTHAGGQEADTDAGGRMQQPEPAGEDGAPTGFFSFERQNHGAAGRVQ